MNKSRIAFVNFPYDFIGRNNFVIDILEILSSRNDSVRHSLENMDFIFSGCYPQTNLVRKSLNRIRAQLSSRQMTRWLQLQYGFEDFSSNYKKSMWITFENRRPPYRHFQRSLSFDLDTYSNTNHYLPLWLTYIDFLETQGNWVRHKVTQSTLLTHRKNKPSMKKFACAFINNPNPMRLRAIRELSKVGQVDVFGRYTNAYVKNKIDKSSEYMFSVCFENDIYPGYVTEKPLEAWLGETIPLYWGSDSAQYLNSSAIINLNDFSSLDTFCNYVKEVSSNETLYNAIYNQPFLRKPYDVKGLLDFFENWILE